MSVEQIEAIRTQAIVQMQNLLANTGPTITAGSEEIPWAPLLIPLERTIEWCDRKLAEYEPYEVRSRGTT
jgi:hypothetical protein